jgi:hypothetical protein
MLHFSLFWFIFTNTSFLVLFQKIDFQLGAITIGVELKRVGTN